MFLRKTLRRFTLEVLFEAAGSLGVIMRKANQGVQVDSLILLRLTSNILYASRRRLWGILK